MSLTVFEKQLYLIVREGGRVTKAVAIKLIVISKT